MRASAAARARRFLVRCNASGWAMSIVAPRLPLNELASGQTNTHGGERYVQTQKPRDADGAGRDCADRVELRTAVHGGAGDRYAVGALPGISVYAVQDDRRRPDRLSAGHG